MGNAYRVVVAKDCNEVVYIVKASTNAELKSLIEKINYQISEVTPINTEVIYPSVFPKGNYLNLYSVILSNRYGNKEILIPGDSMKSAIIEAIDSVGEDYKFSGIYLHESRVGFIE